MHLLKKFSCVLISCIVWRYIEMRESGGVSEHWPMMGKHLQLALWSMLSTYLLYVSTSSIRYVHVSSVLCLHLWQSLWQDLLNTHWADVLCSCFVHQSLHLLLVNVWRTSFGWANNQVSTHICPMCFRCQHWFWLTCCICWLDAF